MACMHRSDRLPPSVLILLFIYINNINRAEERAKKRP
jgi:hypothetical protein